jgi:energy-coupling factor transporter ATP-binding protein EcfA2
VASRTQPTCFISYCRDNGDSESIKHLVDSLRQTSRNKIEFLFDEDQLPGSDLYDFMTRIKDVDGVIILLSPEYKARVENRQGGVYREYKEIILRRDEQEEEANSQPPQEGKTTKNRSPFYIAPIIFSGTYETACPGDLKRPLCVDFTQYRAHRSHNKLHVTSQIQNQFAKKISQIVSSIIARHSLRTEEVTKSFEDLLDSFFLNTKHEHLRGDPKFESEIENVFVKTYSYKKVRRQTSYLLIGRKGSGKSTIVDYLARDSDDRYKAAIEINVDHFDLEHLYSVLTPRQLLSEFDVVVSRVEIFEVVWELFLNTCCAHRLLIEAVEGKLKQSQLMLLRPLESLYFRITGTIFSTEHTLDYRALFRWCYSRIVEQIEGAIEASRDGIAAFSYDVAARLDGERMLETALSPEALQALDGILRQCSRRFLISFDGFDTAFEEFRIRTQQSVADTHQRKSRTDFEIDWLRGFAHLAIKIKSAPRRTPLSNLVDFCATIPKDRFVEIRDAERDAYVYIGKCYEIRWSAIELAILLYKRLEVLQPGGRTNPDEQPHKRLEHVLRNSFSYIPHETVTTIESGDHLLPIFIDVLRHTFWRPREILIYFAKIIAVLRDIKKRNIEVSQFAVSKCISDTTREIIRTEFLNEFQRHCVNLREIVERFRRSRQIVELADVQALIGGMAFNFADRKEPVLDFSKQVKFLYEIGFIGLEAAKNIVQRLKLLHSDVFCFNAGDEPFEVIMHDGFRDCRFIIHPIFCEFLDLDVHNQRLTLKFDWQYLQQQEAHVIVPS